MPPVDTHQRDLIIKTTSQTWYRNHRWKYAPIHFSKDKTRGRFNDPEQEFGVLYLGEDEYCAFIEVHGLTHGKTTPYLGDNIISESEIEARCLCPVHVVGELNLVDLTAHGLARVGADNRLCTGSWAVSQQWSRVLWSHPAQPDGIYYRARHDASRFAVALFDRVAPRLSSQCIHRSYSCCSHNMLRDRARLAVTLDLYGFALIPD
jgi:hypothetical protein